MLLSKRTFKIFIWLVAPLVLIALSNQVEGETTEPRGEIRVVENWRPDVNVLGHNVLQCLFEYSLDRNELVPSLAVSREWVDDTTLEVKLRQGVRFHNGEPFDANAVKFNFEYQRQHNPGRGVQVYMRNLREIQVLDLYTIRMALAEPDALFLGRIIIGAISGWLIGAPRYMEWHIGRHNGEEYLIERSPVKIEILGTLPPFGSGEDGILTSSVGLMPRSLQTQSIGKRDFPK
jgi:ABC-type transport system substrate-binding protein